MSTVSTVLQQYIDMERALNPFIRACNEAASIGIHDPRRHDYVGAFDFADLKKQAQHIESELAAINQSGGNKADLISNSRDLWNIIQSAEEMRTTIDDKTPEMMLQYLLQAQDVISEQIDILKRDGAAGGGGVQRVYKHCVSLLHRIETYISREGVDASCALNDVDVRRLAKSIDEWNENDMGTGWKDRRLIADVQSAYGKLQALMSSDNVVVSAAAYRAAIKNLVDKVEATLKPDRGQSDSTAAEIDRILRESGTDESDDYNRDIRETLKELKICFMGKCYIACMCLCGRMMEAALKMRFVHLEKEAQDGVLNEFRKRYPEVRNKAPDDLGLGELIALSKTAGQDRVGRLPEGLTHDADKIKRFRNSYVHAREIGEPPIPSENDTRSVIHTLAEVLSRTYALMKIRPPESKTP